MEKISFNVGKEFCEECSLALKRFIGKMEGVESIDVESGHILVEYDSSQITESELSRITRDSIEKLGYKLLE
ncbi:MAG: heavy-metal-associated domain-containing protein [Nitrospirae bacterium]|nr:heavy-metal-associated domain-containing protein [Nitrospirota bacterium]